jgi:hypothetical protein
MTVLPVRRPLPCPLRHTPDITNSDRSFTTYLHKRQDQRAAGGGEWVLTRRSRCSLLWLPCREHRATIAAASVLRV